MLVGNPVRDEVARAAATSRSRRSTRTAPFRMLVTGGSQGATVLSEVVPEGAGPARAERFRRRLQVTQQCRADDIEAVRDALCRARHSGRARHLYRGHARPARRGASGHRPRRRLDHRRADRRRPARDPDPAADRDRRPPDRQRARDGQGRRRAHDPRRTSFTPERARQADQRPWPATRRRSPMPRRGRCRSAGRTPRSDLADLVERIGGGAGADRWSARR